MRRFKKEDLLKAVREVIIDEVKLETDDRKEEILDMVNDPDLTNVDKKYFSIFIAHKMHKFDAKLDKYALLYKQIAEFDGDEVPMISLANSIMRYYARYYDLDLKLKDLGILGPNELTVKDFDCLLSTIPAKRVIHTIDDMVDEALKHAASYYDKDTINTMCKISGVLQSECPVDFILQYLIFKEIIENEARACCGSGPLVITKSKLIEYDTAGLLYERLVTDHNNEILSIEASEENVLFERRK